MAASPSLYRRILPTPKIRVKPISYLLMVASGPVSRILYPKGCLPSNDDHFSGTRVTVGFKQPTRELRPGQPLSRHLGFYPKNRQASSPYLVLLQVMLTLPSVSPQMRWALTPPFHPYRIRVSPEHRRYIFCGAHVGLLRLGVTQHLALWSPDFPLVVYPTSSHPAHYLHHSQ